MGRRASGGAGYGAPPEPGAGLPSGESYGPPQADPRGAAWAGDSAFQGAQDAPTGDPYGGRVPRWCVLLFVALACLPVASCAGCTVSGCVLGYELGHKGK